MNEFSEALNAVLPEQHRGTVALVLVLVRYSGEIFSALRNRGGLRGIYRGVVFGENVPRPISNDYSRELKLKPLAPSSDEKQNP